VSTVDEQTVSRSRGWSALPRRRPPRPRPAVFALRVPISRRSRTVLIVLSIVVPLVAWWILSVSGVVRPAQYLPTPGATLRGLRDLAVSGELLTDAWSSIQRVLWGYGIAVLVSVPLGIAMGSFRSVWSLFEPVIGLLRYLPAGAFSPLLIIWLGLGEEPKATLIFIGTFFFNTLMTADVVRGVPLRLI
jgi:NitT/TauT family transport system permease protein